MGLASESNPGRISLNTTLAMHTRTLRPLQRTEKLVQLLRGTAQFFQ